jgi:predicted nucleic acid-binding protein
MGLILDSSVLIKAERQGQNVRQMLAAISRTAGNTDIAISVVTLIELAHGAARADTAQRKAK